MDKARRIIRPRETCRRTGLSATTIWRYERDRKFPKRLKLNDDGSIVGHYEDEVEDWIRRRIRAGGKPVRASGGKAGNERLAADGQTS